MFIASLSIPLSTGTCQESTCENGGVCTEVEGGSVCLCQTGYVGPQCSIPIVGMSFLIAKLPKKMEILCNRELVWNCCNLRYACYHYMTTVPFLIGTSCQDTTCQNGGTCTEVAEGGSMCLCQNGYGGSQCSLAVPVGKYNTEKLYL